MNSSLLAHEFTPSYFLSGMELSLIPFVGAWTNHKIQARFGQAAVLADHMGNTGGKCSIKFLCNMLHRGKIAKRLGWVVELYSVNQKTQLADFISVRRQVTSRAL